MQTRYVYSPFYKPSMQNKFAFAPRKNALIVIYYEYSSFYKLTTQNNFALTENRNALIVIMNFPRPIRHLRETISLSHKVETH